MPKFDNLDDSSMTWHNPRIKPEEVPPQIWLIGGTTEALKLSQSMVQNSLPCTVSITSETARFRYPSASLLQVRVQQFNYETLTQFLQAEKIVVILDASHPYAAAISQLAIQAATDFQIPYLRVERPTVSGPNHHCIQEIEDVAALTHDHLLGQRVLLTLGAKSLYLFRSWQSRSTLFARILPSAAALQAAAEAGFSQDRLIALRPPISLALEMALWKQWRIDRVITKASGQAGGETVKRQAAALLKVPLLVIRRPAVTYPQQTSGLGDAISFCQRCLEAYSS